MTATALAVPILLSALGAGPGAPPASLHLETAGRVAETAGSRPARLDLGAAGAADPREPGSRAGTLAAWGSGLRWGTAGALVATSVLGTMVALNQPTRFGDGRCLTGHPVLGEYGCDRGLSTLHGSAAVLSVTAYTANAVLALAAPESRGEVAAGARPVHRALTWVHLGGIVLQPVLGLVAAFPQVVGRSRSAPTDNFPRNLRTAHIVLGYVTTAAFLTTAALEW